MREATCPDRDSLLSLAAGEAGTATLADHVRQCPECRLTVTEVGGIVALLRAAGAPGTVPPPVEPWPATIGKYRIVGEVGRGAQACVLRGLHPTLLRDVAIKWAHHPLEADGPDRDRLALEGRLLAALDHPGLVRVFDLDVHDGRPFLVMEYVRGANLEQHAAQARPSPTAAAALVAQLARALAAAHRRGVIHQDVKPTNVLIDDAGQPRLSDFGIARLGDLWSDPAETPPAGTLAYMPPEQLAGQPTPLSDVYALGGVLFFLLTGRHPRDIGDNPALALQKVARSDLDLAPLRDPQLPRRLVAICRRALATQPAERFQSAEAMAAALEQVAERPNRVRRGLGWAAAFLAVLALGGFAWLLRPTSEPAPAPAVAARPSLAVRLLRGGEYFGPKAPDDFAALLPLRADDRLGFSGTAPQPLHLALFAVTLSDLPRMHVQRLAVRDDPSAAFTFEQMVPLEGSPASELLFACGSSTATPTAADVQTLIAELGWARPDAWKLPPNQLIFFDSPAGPAEVRARVGTPEADPVREARAALDELRAKLRTRYDYVAGVAFQHVALPMPAGEERGPPDRQEAPQRERPQAGPKAEDPDAALFRKVMQRLLSSQRIRDTWPRNYAWPPRLAVVPDRKKLNAYAAPIAVDPATKKLTTLASVTQGYLDKIVRGDEPVLAAIMGHELAHITRGHFAKPQGKTFELLAFNREQELEADLEGVQIAVSAGYPWRAGVRAAFKEYKALGDRSNFENLTGTHPTWVERLQFLDRAEPKIWSAMSAFQNGVFFLSVEQYAAAESCFKKVTDDFPACAEAWTNLGHARLMRYCDGLEPADIRKLGIGQIAAGCFYARPASIAPVRGSDEALWQAAVQALTTALVKDRNRTLAEANLGLAHLVHANDEKAENLVKARKHFELALDRVRQDKGLDSLNGAALLVNHGVTLLAAGETKDAERAFVAAVKVLDQAKLSQLRFQVEDAILYNLTLVKGAVPAERRKALDGVQRYLEVASIDAIWWPLAYERYVRLAADVNLQPLPQEAFTKRNADGRFRVLTDVTTGPGTTIALGTPLAAALKTLGHGTDDGIPAYLYAKIRRYNDVRPGIDLLGSTDVLAIFLVNDEAPPVTVQGRGAGAAKHAVRVGMAAADLYAAIGKATHETRDLGDPRWQYEFFPAIGLAARIQNDRVAELVVVQLPRKTGR